VQDKKLILFTRFPEPGETKTRLIPALGPDGAAALHRALTEHALEQARRFQRRHRAALDVYFAGGDERSMRAWLGQDLTYRPQAAGDLGDRMRAAFAAAFASRARTVVIMGADCPGLTADVLTEALLHLQRDDLVLGPSSDGGYYLIGLKALFPSLFSNIPWGTDQVLAATHRKAMMQGLHVALLAPLPDIDRPQDLEHARACLPDGTSNGSQAERPWP
jgi:rSAM/selenodomain-associated transferase 1